MCLPTSDIDIVLISKSGDSVPDPLQLLNFVMNILVKKQWVLTMNVITSASMPVMKIECTPEMHNTKIDITVQDARHKGLECVNLVKDILKTYVHLEPILLVLKYILKQAELNDPYKVFIIIYIVGRAWFLWNYFANFGFLPTAARKK